MNKLGIVLGAAAVAIVAGCMDPNYVRSGKNGPQDVATPAGGDQSTPTLTPDVKPVADDQLPGYPGDTTQEPEIDISVTPVTGCTCAPGTVHDAPCTCGAPDCQCKVAVPPPQTDVQPVEQVDENTTVYVIHPGDTLFLISKRFNVKLDSIRKANPQVKNDNIRVGQKLVLPAKVELGKFAEPIPVTPAPKPEFVAYNGPTTEYVVKNGDCLSVIARKNGLTTKQLKVLNNLTDNNIRIGQKLLIPASGAAAVATAAAAPAVVKTVEKPTAKKDAPKAVVQPTKPPQVVAQPVIEEPEIDDVPVIDPDEKPVTVTPPVQQATTPSADNNGDYITYVVMKGEDITALSISFGIDPSVIRELNNMGDDEDVVPNQTIRLPADAQ